MQKRSTEWLLHKNFFEATGFKRENVNYCLERHEKAGICLKLGITRFIDDRLDVLKHIAIHPGITCFLLSNYPANRQKSYVYFLPNIVKVKSWDEIGSHINKPY